MKPKIWITSTARKIGMEEILPAMRLLESWGYVPLVSKTIGLQLHQYAGSDAERAFELQYALDSPEIKAIWCARGGYGTVRVIDLLDFTNYLKYPKPIIGYSDVTVLHNHLTNLGLQSIHATMPVNIASNSAEAIASLKLALSGLKPEYSITSAPENRNGLASGTFVGGNLSILYSLLGSKTALKTEGKILFIEDLDEYLYHIDRMLINLKRNGYFDGLAGLVVGSFTKMKDNTIPFGKTAKEIIMDAVDEYPFPVLFDFPAGHIDDNRALIMGAVAQMQVGTNISSLKFL